MRIASLNALSDPELRLERLTQMFVEAAELRVDALALQELPAAVHEDVQGIAEAHGYTSSHLVTGVPGDEVGTFSREPFDEVGVFTVAHPGGAAGKWPPVGTPAAVRSFSWARLRGFVLCNVHLTWGAHNEPARLREVVGIEAFAGEMVDRASSTEGEQTRELIPVLLGDFNAEPDNDCVRFLRGKTPIDGVGTYWTDATLGTDLQHAPTTRETNQWGQQSARSRGVDASLLYPRRIDFMFARGWRHGGRGTFTSVERFGASVTPDGVELSDHYGWVADIEE